MKLFESQVIDCNIQEMMGVEPFDLLDDMSVEALCHTIESDVKAVYAE